VRRATAYAVLRHGKGVDDLDVAVAISAEASGLSLGALRAETRARAEASTRDFNAMRAT
jgi:hypothetical protein